MTLPPKLSVSSLLASCPAPLACAWGEAARWPCPPAREQPLGLCPPQKAAIRSLLQSTAGVQHCSRPKIKGTVAKWCSRLTWPLRWPLRPLASLPPASSHTPSSSLRS